MSKLLLFLLIFASFSCATLDSNLKENSNIEKTEKIEESKEETTVVATVFDKPVTIKDPNELKKTEENVHPAKYSFAIQEEQQDDVEEVIPVSSTETEKKDNSEKQREDKKEEKTYVNKKGSNEDDKSDKKEPSKDISIKNPEKQVVLPTNKNNEERGDESKENTIENEKALQNYDDMFSSPKVEQQKEEKLEKEEKIVVLPSLEILKELEEAISFFQKVKPSVVTKQRVEKTTKKDVAVEDAELDLTTSDMVKEDEFNSSNELPIEETNDDGNMLALNDDEVSSDGENILTFEDETMLNFDDEQERPLNFNEEVPSFSFDEEPPVFSFDDEKEDEKTKNDKLAKKDVGDSKGQLSSIVDEEDKVNISRYTDILKGQNIDFSYPGEGWVYLGEETSQKGLTYIKRKMEDGRTFFTFMAENVGNYVLNFSYFDVFSGDFIVDAVSVKVMPNNDGIQKDSLVLEYQGKKNEKKVVEKQVKKTPNEVNVDADKVGIKTEQTTKKEVTPAKQPSDNMVVESNMETLKPAIPNKPKEEAVYKEPEVFTNVASINPDNAKTKIAGGGAKKIIDEVSKEISNGNAKKALEKLDDFFATASTNIDEAYFLRGKAYELNTEQKNIKLALAAYKFLTKTFPNSPFWSEADARIRYIEKFFVKIK